MRPVPTLVLLFTLAAMTSACAQQTGVSYLRGTPMQHINPRPQPVSFLDTRDYGAGLAKNHAVQRGDTIYSLARRYDIPPDMLITANRLRRPYRLYVGQSLYIPPRAYHRVGAGETVASIARRYNVPPASIISYNKIVAPDRLPLGSQIMVPNANQRITGYENSFEDRILSVLRDYRRTDVAATRYASVPTGAIRPPTLDLPTPPPRAGARFSWPVSGRIIARYGAQESGQHNDGINIAVPSGSDIRAAENGVVAYTGGALKGFGQLVLIKHSGGWITAYAHNSQVLVRRGDKVGRGQLIAKSGASGYVSSPQLHFEIRRGKQAVDPLQYM